MVKQYDKLEDLPQDFREIMIINSEFAEKAEIKFRHVTEEIVYFSVKYFYDSKLVSLTTQDYMDESILENQDVFELNGKIYAYEDKGKDGLYCRWLDRNHEVILYIPSELEDQLSEILVNLEWYEENHKQKS